MKSILFSLALFAAAQPADVLTPFGLGAVRIGMSVPEAEKALKTRLKVELIEVDADESCGYATRADKRDANLAYMVEDGRITRIDVIQPRRGSGPERRVTAATGLGVGSSEDEVRKAYGSAMTAEPNPYDDRERYLKVEEPDHKRGLVFETLGGKIYSMRAGEYPALDYAEGCL